MVRIHPPDFPETYAPEDRNLRFVAVATQIRAPTMNRDSGPAKGQPRGAAFSFLRARHI